MRKDIAFASRREAGAGRAWMPMLRSLLLLVVAGLLGSASLAEEDRAARSAVPGLQGVYEVGPGLYTGGLQDEAQLAKLQEMGVRHVIDLRTDAEPDVAEEAEIAARLGLRYERIPIGAPVDLHLENARALDAALEAAGDEPVLVHCASANRAGALLALREGLVRGEEPEVALELGRRSGMESSLEPFVAERLGAEGAPPDAP
jgi:uncharacterized protein (TIGR01244 family)